jgi:peptidoglycan/LPS O-acetylase OafA/YrhL
MADERQSQHIVGLDLLRVAAACLVMMYHFAFWHWTRGNTVLPGAFGAPPWSGIHLDFGWVGVEIFFVISGYVITLSASGPGMSAARFLRSRFMRLVPCAWICATLAFMVYVWLPAQYSAKIYLDYVATMAFWPLRSIDGVYWTLGIEVSFYILVFALLRLRRLATLESVVTRIGLASGVFWACALLTVSLTEAAVGWPATLHMLVTRAEANRELQLLLVQHGCFFALGTVMSKAATGGFTRARGLALASLGAACVLEIIGQNSIIERASQLSLSALPAVAIWLTAVAVLALAATCNNSLLRWLGRTAKAVRFAGLTTYPLYLVHNPLGLGLTILLAPYLGLSAMVIGLAGAIIGAALIARYGEPALSAALRHVWPPAVGGHDLHVRGQLPKAVTVLSGEAQ